jgi:hypothetical protein
MKRKRPDSIEIYKDKKREWRWRVLGPNGAVLGGMQEGNKPRWYAVKMAKRLFPNLEITIV